MEPRLRFWYGNQFKQVWQSNQFKQVKKGLARFQFA